MAVLNNFFPVDNNKPALQTSVSEIEAIAKKHSLQGINKQVNNLKNPK